MVVSLKHMDVVGMTWIDWQFNNGHLMRVKGLYVNPNELISYVVYDVEEE